MVSRDTSEFDSLDFGDHRNSKLAVASIATVSSTILPRGEGGSRLAALAEVVKSADTQDLGSCAFGREGSSPSFRTRFMNAAGWERFSQGFRDRRGAQYVSAPA